MLKPKDIFLLIIHLFILLNLINANNSLFANEKIPNHLKIIFPKVKQKIGKFKYNIQELNQLKKICNQFGKSFTYNQSALGGGIIKTYSCYVDKQSLDDNTSKTNNIKNHFLKLDINWNDKQITTLKIYRVHKLNNNSEKKFIEAQMQIPYPQMALKILQDQRIINLSVHALLSQMYAYGTINDKLEAQFLNDTIILPQPLLHPYEITIPSKTILIYTLELTSKLYLKAKFIGHANFVENKENTSIWKIQWKLKPTPSQLLWFKFDQRRDAPINLILSHINNISDIITKKSKKDNIIKKTATELMYSVASGYIGIRYSLPFLNTDAIFFKDTPMYGVFIETRGGTLSGLRFYYDQTPKKTKISARPTQEQIKYYSSRLSLGWAFQKDFGLKFINNINITPKFGSWVFIAALPLNENGTLENSPNANIYYLEIPKAYTFGLEIGIEKFWKNTLLRAWFNSDITASNITKGNKVSSYRSGVDIHIGGPNIIANLNLSFLAFCFTELLNLDAQKENKNNLNYTKNYINNLIISNNFIGTGMSIAW